MMIKIKYAFALLIVILAVTVSCKKDDDDGPIGPPPRDRGEEAIRAQDSIEKFLQTHYYNYWEFQSDPDNFKLRFGKIETENDTVVPLIDQVVSKEVRDVVDNSVVYKLYYLEVRKGGGETPHFSDYTTNTYDGRLMNLDLFDSSVIPVRFSLVESPGSQVIIRGLQQAMIEFKGASNIISNPDGTLTFENYGIGAVFIPSGLAYFNFGAPGGLDPYEQVIFSFELFESEVADHDNDGIPSYMEDINNLDYQYLMDDDTDGDGIPNYLDDDDDGDGRLTKFEIEIINGVLTFPDTNGNGTPDYLDPTI